MSPKTPLGQFLSCIVMMLGYAIIAVPTGIVSVQLHQVATAANACKKCGEKSHERDSAFCRICGNSLHSPVVPPVDEAPVAVPDKLALETELRLYTKKLEENKTSSSN